MTASIHPDRMYEQLARKHATKHTDWINGVYTDYWLAPGPGALTATTGFTFTSLVATVGSGADLMSSTDVGTPAAIETNATGDLLQSPAIFADYSHALAAAKIMGMNNRLPTKFVVEMYVSWPVASADEDQSAIGLFEDGATISTAADQLAVVYSNGVNFLFKNGAGTGTVTGPVIATTPKLYKMVLDKTAGDIKCFVDNTYYAALTLEADEFPAYFGLHSLTTNTIALHWAHLWYDW